MDLEKIRADFPVTRHTAYLENGGFSPTPMPVAKAVYEYLEEAGSGFTTQFIGKTLDMAADTRAKLASFLGGSQEEIAIVRNTADAATHVAAGLEWEEGDKILISEVEHPSNWLPWVRLQKMGVKTVVVPVKQDGRVDPEDFHRLIDKKTRLIALNHIPSPSGIIQPCEEVGKIARDSGVLFYVDAAQSAGQVRVDVKRLNCDFLAFTCAKFMCGPQGTGVFYIRNGLLDKMEPSSIGWFNIDHDKSTITLGDFANRAVEAEVKTKSTAEAFEAPGTPPWALIAGLRRAVQ
jgi:cysteine desulfurase / selenocysteine lyase